MVDWWSLIHASTWNQWYQQQSTSSSDLLYRMHKDLFIFFSIRKSNRAKKKFGAKVKSKSIWLIKCKEWMICARRETEKNSQELIIMNKVWRNFYRKQSNLSQYMYRIRMGININIKYYINIKQSIVDFEGKRVMEKLINIEIQKHFILAKFQFSFITPKNIKITTIYLYAAFV